MRPMLDDDLELTLVQEICSYDRRTLAEHKPPGMAGSLLQNLGRRPTRLVLWGVAAGPDALETTQKLDEKFRAAEPVTFTADIVSDAEIQQMVIDDLKIQELAGKPERFSYVLTLREFIEPVEPAEAPAELDAGILDDATSLMDDLIDALDIGIDFPTGLEQFVSPLNSLLTRLQDFNKSLGNP